MFPAGMRIVRDGSPLMSESYRPLWWHPWLEPVTAPLGGPATPDVTGYQLVEAPEAGEPLPADGPREPLD